MGEVYRAKDTRLERTVAVKVLPAHLSKNEEFRQRFEREAKTISRSGAVPTDHARSELGVRNPEVGRPFVILRSPTRQSRSGDGAAEGPKNLLNLITRADPSLRSG